MNKSKVISIGIGILFFVAVYINKNSLLNIFFPWYEKQMISSCSGNEAIRLTENNTYDEIPKWSPDSKWLAYISEDSGEQIYLIDPLTRRRFQITDNKGYYYNYGDISWSPDGKKILLPVVYFSGPVEPYFSSSVFIDIQESIIIPFIQSKYNDFQSIIPGYPVDWSPDGKKILVMNTQENGDFDTVAIFIYQMDNTSIFQVSPANLRVWGASWSPNGDQIAYSATLEDGDTEIYLINVDGTNNIQITDNDANDIEPIWSADGKYIAYTTNRNGNWDIYVFSVGTNKTIQITDNPLQELATSWNSENMIAFMANWDSSNPQDIILDENVFLSLSDQEIYIMEVCIQG